MVFIVFLNLSYSIHFIFLNLLVGAGQLSDDANEILLFARVRLEQAADKARKFLKQVSSFNKRLKF